MPFGIHRGDGHKNVQPTNNSGNTNPAGKTLSGKEQQKLITKVVQDSKTAVELEGKIANLQQEQANNLASMEKDKAAMKQLQADRVENKTERTTREANMEKARAILAQKQAERLAAEKVKKNN